MSFGLFYNSEVIGANIVSVQQKMSNAGLGDVWSESLGQWTTLAAAYADRTTPLTETAEGSGVGYAAVIDFDTDYTGALMIGYYDGEKLDPGSGSYVPNVKPLFTERRYVRRGREFDFVVAVDRTNHDLSRLFIFEISKRTDGTYAAKDSITISPKDDFNFSYNLPKLLPSNLSVAQIQEVTVSPSGTLSVVEAGSQGAYPILSLEGGQVAGTTYVVSCVVIMNTGDQFECEGTFVCVS